LNPSFELNKREEFGNHDQDELPESDIIFIHINIADVHLEKTRSDLISLKTPVS
jgi:hypothetical protein